MRGSSNEVELGLKAQRAQSLSKKHFAKVPAAVFDYDISLAEFKMLIFLHMLQLPFQVTLIHSDYAHFVEKRAYSAYLLGLHRKKCIYKFYSKLHHHTVVLLAHDYLYGLYYLYEMGMKEHIAPIIEHFTGKKDLEKVLSHLTGQEYLDAIKDAVNS